MKRIVFVIMCLASIAMQAQQVHFSPKVGMNVSSMTNSDGADARVGLNAGVAAEFSLGERFAIEPGVFYSMQGIKDSESGISVTLKNDYINVPVLAKYYVYEGLSVFAGPQVGFLVNSKADVSTSGVSVSADIKDAFKTIDLAAVIGVGYQLPMGLNFALNYNLGLLNVLEGSSFNVGDETLDWGNEKSRNNVFQVSVGWRF